MDKQSRFKALDRCRAVLVRQVREAGMQVRRLDSTTVANILDRSQSKV